MCSKHSAFLRCYEHRFAVFVIEALVQHRGPFLLQLQYYVTKIFQGRLQSSSQVCDRNKQVIVVAMLNFLAVLQKNDPNLFLRAYIKFHAELLAFRLIFLKGILWIRLFFLLTILLENLVFERYKWILSRDHMAIIYFWNYFQFFPLLFDLLHLYLFGE